MEDKYEIGGGLPHLKVIHLNGHMTKERLFFLLGEDGSWTVEPMECVTLCTIPEPFWTVIKNGPMDPGLFAYLKVKGVI